MTSTTGHPPELWPTETSRIGTVVHHDPVRTDPDTSDASLRAALERERANADHLRSVNREQARVLRRPLVRIGRRLDREGSRALGLLAHHAGRVARGAARAELAVAALGVRDDLDGRARRLERAVADLDPAPSPSARVSVVLVADGPVDAPVIEGVDHELVVFFSGEGAVAPEGADSVVAAGHRTSRATAAQRGAARATGRAVCFLEPTSEPLDPAWLARLTAVLDDTTVAATPMLVHPRRPPTRATPHDLQVRELGLDLVDTDASGPRVVAHDAGEPPHPAGRPVEVAAGSSACLVVDRAAYDEAGGLAPLDDLDAAMVDLCSRIRAGGKRVLAVPSAVVVDHRPVRSRRSLELPVDPRSPGWRAVVHRQGAALAQLARGSRLTEHLRIALTVAAPSARVAPLWGDWHLGEAMARSLRRQGHSVRLQRADQADDLAGRSCDVHVVLRGLNPVPRTPGQRHVLWLISHPESVGQLELDEADLILVASHRYADHLRTLTDTPVDVLLQATDHRRFRPRPPDPRHAHAVAVVASTRHVFRPSVKAALDAGLRPAIYGSGWHEFVDRELIVADYVRNEQLPDVYSSIGVLLNDHWDTMRALGFVSNRLFDALACGTPVVTDHLPELDDLFGDSIASYSSPADLHDEVQAALDDPVGARRRAAEGRERVLAGHTFDHRAGQLLAALDRYELVGSR